jgi:CelD/BcsL family acetyltransferase involved in cellulose biosynthesis
MLSRKERTKVRTRGRRLERRYDMEIRVCRDEQSLPAYLETLFTLHEKRWQVRGEPGSFGSAQRRTFYRKMSARFLRRGWLDLSQLAVNGKVVAAQLGFRFRGTEYSLQEGFDPDYSGDSVGYVLRACNLQRLIGDGIRRYDFLAGRDPAKDRWGASHEAYLDLQFARPRSAGAAYLTALHKSSEARCWFRERFRSGPLT